VKLEGLQLLNYTMELFLFILSCIGATFIINISYVFKPIREKASMFNPHLGKFLKCPQCIGFWVGLVIRVLFMWHGGEFSNIQLSDLYNVIYGFASSFVCYSSYLLLKFFMDKYD
jgi:hypothetical protein